LSTEWARKVAGGTPRLHVLSHREHGQVPIEKDDVDRETHECGVHDPFGPHQHATGQRRAPAEASHPADEAARELAPFANDLTFGSDKDKRALKAASIAARGWNRVYRTGSLNYPMDRPLR
jgi:hypothetical protein